MSMHETRLETLRNECRPSLDIAYFNSAAHGLVPRSTHEAIQQYLMELQGGATEQEFKPILHELRKMLGKLIQSPPEALAFCKNVSDGLNVLMQGYPWQPGDELIICPEIEHPTLVWIAQFLRRRGVVIKTVEAPHGTLRADLVVEAMSPKTRMVAFSAVSFLNGTRVDLEHLGILCRQQGIFVLVDAAQSVGFSRVDVDRLMIDGLVANTHKGLLGVSGLGFFYLRAQWLTDIAPLAIGMEGIIGSGDSWDWVPTMQRFEVGHVNSLAATAALHSIPMLLDIGIDAIETQIQRIRKHLVEGLDARGLPIVAREATSHIVSVIPRQGSAAQWVAALEERRIKAAVRGGHVRFSLHAYTSIEDVEGLMDQLDQLGMR